MIVELDAQRPIFPLVEQALTEPDGLLCVGGNLEPETLIAAYSKGIFPWFSEGQPLLWWSPDPRLVMTPDSLHISRSLRRFLRRSSWRVTCNTAFVAVMRACAQVPRAHESGTWITEEMLQAYTRLHHLGRAQSTEVWDAEGQLVGGLYGVALGRVFFGESMFSLRSNASRMALCHLLHSGCYDLVDCQMETAHLTSMGGVSVPRATFCRWVEQLIAAPESTGK